MSMVPRRKPIDISTIDFRPVLKSAQDLWTQAQTGTQGFQMGKVRRKCIYHAIIKDPGCINMAIMQGSAEDFINNGAQLPANDMEAISSAIEELMGPL